MLKLELEVQNFFVKKLLKGKSYLESLNHPDLDCVSLSNNDGQMRRDNSLSLKESLSQPAFFLFSALSHDDIEMVQSVTSSNMSGPWFNQERT